MLPDNDRGRPGESGLVVDDPQGATVMVRPVADIPGQIGRRRHASYRLEPLDDGRRDPLDRTGRRPADSTASDIWALAAQIGGRPYDYDQPDPVCTCCTACARRKVHA